MVGCYRCEKLDLDQWWVAKAHSGKEKSARGPSSPGCRGEELHLVGRNGGARHAREERSSIWSGGADTIGVGLRERGAPRWRRNEGALLSIRRDSRELARENKNKTRSDR